MWYSLLLLFSLLHLSSCSRCGGFLTAACLCYWSQLASYTFWPRTALGDGPASYSTPHWWAFSLFHVVFSCLCGCWTFDHADWSICCATTFCLINQYYTLAALPKQHSATEHAKSKLGNGIACTGLVTVNGTNSTRDDKYRWNSAKLRSGGLLFNLPFTHWSIFILFFYFFIFLLQYV